MTEKKTIKPARQPALAKAKLLLAGNTMHSVAGGEKYFEAIGRRKTSTARVRISEASKASFVVNGKDAKEYFKTEDQRRLIQDPIIKGFSAVKPGFKWGVTVKVDGGGIHSQAEAVRHGIAKTLILFNLEFRQKLKKAGFLTRDPRMRERKKFGLKRARRAPQWSKR